MGGGWPLSPAAHPPCLPSTFIGIGGRPASVRYKEYQNGNGERGNEGGMSGPPASVGLGGGFFRFSFSLPPLLRELSTVFLDISGECRPLFPRFAQYSSVLF